MFNIYINFNIVKLVFFFKSQGLAIKTKAFFKFFPFCLPSQIDLRVLKPVAIEYREDADAAVEFIFSEVLPSLDVQKEDSLSSDFHLQNSLKSLKGLQC